MDLQTLWFAAVAVLWIGFLLLEGFDFGVAALLLSLIYRVYLAHATLDTDSLAEAEEAEELLAELEAGTDDAIDDGEILARESHVA